MKVSSRYIRKLLHSYYLVLRELTRLGACLVSVCLSQGEVARLMAVNGAAGDIDFVEWMCIHCEDVATPLCHLGRPPESQGPASYDASPNMSSAMATSWPNEASPTSRSAQISKLMAQGEARLSRATAAN